LTTAIVRDTLAYAVRDVSLQSAADAEVWQFAAQHGLTIMSKEDAAAVMGDVALEDHTRREHTTARVEPADPSAAATATAR
jgi:hypothetical protein